jgi:hypothetical protein
MFPLALSVTILDEHTRLARLETNAPINAALGTAISRRIVPKLGIRIIVTVIHGGRQIARMTPQVEEELKSKYLTCPRSLKIKDGIEIDITITTI